MKNTAKKGIVHFLVLKSGDKYIGISKEFGFVEEAETFEAVEKRLINSAILLIKTVRENPRLEPSLNVRPPFKYHMLYLILPIVSSFTSLFGKFSGNLYQITKKLDGQTLSQSVR